MPHPGHGRILTMPRGIPLTKEQEQAIIDGLAAGIPKLTMATQLRIPRRTVRDVAARHGARVEMSRAAVNEHQLTRWGAIFEGATDKLLDQLEGEAQGSTTDMRNLAIISGIATEKYQLLSGAPTVRIEGIHEHRHELPGLLARLVAVQKQVQGRVIETRPLASIGGS